MTKPKQPAKKRSNHTAPNFSLLPACADQRFNGSPIVWALSFFTAVYPLPLDCD